MTILRILVSLIHVILKLFADVLVRGGFLLVSVLVSVALMLAGIWFLSLFAISVFRRSRSQS